MITTPWAVLIEQPPVWTYATCAKQISVLTRPLSRDWGARPTELPASNDTYANVVKAVRIRARPDQTNDQKIAGWGNAKQLRSQVDLFALQTVEGRRAASIKLLET